MGNLWPGCAKFRISTVSSMIVEQTGRFRILTLFFFPPLVRQQIRQGRSRLHLQPGRNQLRRLGCLRTRPHRQRSDPMRWRVCRAIVMIADEPAIGETALLSEPAPAKHFDGAGKRMGIEGVSRETVRR